MIDDQEIAQAIVTMSAAIAKMSECLEIIATVIVDANQADLFDSSNDEG
jgi:hypothetical protein